MDASMVNDGGNQPSLKVSILARLISTLSYTIPAIGGALSSIFLMRVIRALRENETAIHPLTSPSPSPPFAIAPSHLVRAPTPDSHHSRVRPWQIG